jgi:CRP-like cAMP-binding protein
VGPIDLHAIGVHFSFRADLPPFCTLCMATGLHRGKLGHAPDIGEILSNSSRFKNTLLSRLSADVVKRLSLRRVDFELMHEIEYPGSPIYHLYFVEEGMASMTTTFMDGAQVEVGMFGCESVIGVSALMGTKESLNRVYTQIPGYGYACKVDVAKTEFASGGMFQKLALRYVQAQLVQAMQSAGCNAHHKTNQRLARWLLLCSDRTHCSEFKMPQDFLAEMLGVRRTTVTAAAGVFKEKGLIRYARGKIAILDVPGLTKEACECYGAIKRHLDTFAEFDTDFTS